MELPFSDELNVAGLSASFKNVTNSYKFFWLWAILDDLAENKNQKIKFEDLSMRMISLVWYPLDYYKLSFGKQDSFRIVAANIGKSFTVDNTINSKPLLVQIQNQMEQREANRMINEVNSTLKRYVSYRFLSSFFPNEIHGVKDYKVNGIIKNLSKDLKFLQIVPYQIEDENIRVNEPWVAYFEKHYSILKGFIKWKLVQFLQKNNPYVIGLSEKLEKPFFRDLKMAKGFWMKYINEIPTQCIYSHNRITRSNLSLDHFIPWSYVAHDRLWNIIPTTKSVNSAKSDALPSLEHYFEGFCELQYNAMQFHLRRGSIQYLEEFNSLINLNEICNLSLTEFKERLIPEIDNNFRTAKNLGFQYPFIYRSETP